jgi:hypothetical protein
MRLQLFKDSLVNRKELILVRLDYVPGAGPNSLYRTERNAVRTYKAGTLKPVKRCAPII